MRAKTAAVILTACLLSANGLVHSLAADPSFPSFVEWKPSPNHSERKASKITAIIYHYTAGPSLSGTVTWFQNPQSKVSAHYVVGKDGRIIQMVALDQAAWHAGTSTLAGVEGVNQFSIGIEIVNWGKLTKRDGKFCTYNGQQYHGPEPIKAEGAYWEPFTDEQYKALVRLTSALTQKCPIEHITGHSDIATPKGRKIDPGPAFDWQRVKAGLPSYKGQIGPLKR